MSELKVTLEYLLKGEDLSEAGASDLLLALAEGNVHPAMAGALLAALRAKEVTADELRGFAKTMRRLALHPQLSLAGSPLVDIVGTGGDASGSFNLSTGSALLAASLGMRVAKHGNRSISSRSGSADLIESLGLKLPLDEVAAGRCLQASNFTFLFAPHFHPAMKAIAPIRQAMGVRTIFNILGPLTNPAEPPFHVIGAFNAATAHLIAQTLSGLPIERSFVIHGAAGWDEPTPIGSFTLHDVRPGSVTQHERDPAEWGLPRCREEALQGGDAHHNAAALKTVLSGEDRGAHRDALVLGAALMLEVTGLARDPRTAADAAQQAIDQGRATHVLDRLAAFSTPQHKLV
jgi:anthranilate phosphoribosyltransferase